MSIRVTSKIWDQTYSSLAKKLILLALGDFANDDGYAWPSIETIARKSDCSARHTRRMIAELVAEGELCTATDGRRNVYLVTIGQTPRSIRASLRQYFGFSGEEADREIARLQALDEAAIAAARGESIGDTVSGVEDDAASGKGTQCPVSEGQQEAIGETVSGVMRTSYPPIPESVSGFRTSDPEIEDTVSPKPSVTKHDPPKEPSVDPSCSGSLSDPSVKAQPPTPTTRDEQWAEVLALLRGSLAGPVYDTHLAGTQIVAVERCPDVGEIWRVSVPRAPSVGWLENRLRPVVNRKATAVAGCGVMVAFCSAGGGADG